MTTWLEPEVVAELLPSRPSPRHVRRLAAAEGWKTRRRLRGRQTRAIEIALESLPQDAVARYWASRSQPAEEGATVTLRSFACADKARQDRAEARQRAVIAYELWLQTAAPRWGVPAAERRWLEDYRAQLRRAESPDLETLPGISVASVKRWRRAYNAAGRAIDALVDGNDGSSRRGKTSIPPAILEEFKAIYLRAAKPKVSTCYRRLQKVARARGWESQLPSYDTFRYYARHILPASVASYWREPDKRRENLRPFITRDYADPDFRAMQVIQSDHHQIDVAVSCGDSFCMSGHYPWITVWIDARSRKVLAAEVYIETPNSRRILGLLHRVLVDHGVPQFVYVDNGADFVKAVGKWSIKHFEVGRRGAKNIEVAGWTPDLVERICGPFGIEAIFSTEGNPQSKLIERWFLTLKDRLYALFDSYRGALGERSERAEYLRQHPELLPTITDLAVAVQREIDEYNDAPHRGDGMAGRSPNQVFAETRLPHQTPDRAALAYAFWSEKIGAKVQRQGIKHEHRWYALPPASFVDLFGQKVNIRFDASEPATIAVYDAAWKFVCLATTRESAPQQRGDERIGDQIAELQREWNQVQELLRAHNPSAGKRLEAIAASVEDYHRIQARELAVPQAVGAGGVVTVVDSYLSPLARQIRQAREELAANAGPRLTPEQRALAATAEDHSDEFLDLIAPPLSFRRPPVSAGDDPGDPDDPLYLEAELERIRARHSPTADLD